VIAAAVQTDIVIAAARVEDIPEVQRLANDVWRRHYPGIISDAQIDYMLATGYSVAALEKFFILPGAGLALARTHARAVGLAAWYPLREPREMKLDKLYVLPEHQHAGIGRALIEHVAARARASHLRAVTLNVNRRNVTAIAAYERCSFRIRARGDFPIGNGFVMEDYVMVRDLEDA
jgi:diamine N-acetyltransferase